MSIQLANFIILSRDLCRQGGTEHRKIRYAVPCPGRFLVTHLVLEPVPTSASIIVVYRRALDSLPSLRAHNIGGR